MFPTFACAEVCVAHQNLDLLCANKHFKGHIGNGHHGRSFRPVRERLTEFPFRVPRLRNAQCFRGLLLRQAVGVSPVFETGVTTHFVFHHDERVTNRIQNPMQCQAPFLLIPTR